MKKAVLLIFSVLLLAAPALAQYNIHLKNGFVIKGVGSYEEVDGKIIFRYAGGMVAIPSDEVEGIEEAGREGRVFAPEEAPPQKPREAPMPLMPPESGEAQRIKQRIAEIGERLEEIAQEEAEYVDMVKEYDRVRLRIEVLFQKGIAKARSEGGDPAKWFEFLPPQERKWAQLNTLKKNRFEKELPEKQKELAPLLQEKRALQEEKQSLEERLSRIQSIF